MKKKIVLMGVMVACMVLAGCNNGTSKKSSKPTTRSSVEEESSEPVVLPDYQVKIDSGDGNPTTKTVKLGTALDKPANPTAPSGQAFYGWRNVKNGGEIWDFESRDNNVVMGDVELQPVFVPANQKVQALEAELCPDITERIGKDGTPGMDGETYSGGQAGTGLIGRVSYENGKNKVNASGAYVREEGIARYATEADFANPDTNVIAAYVHYNYVKGNTLTWEFESDVAAENVTLFMSLSGEYGLPEPIQVFEGEGEERVYEQFTDTDFPVKVNDVAVKYGTIAIHNIVPKAILPFRDFMVSATVSLKAGKNTIQMLVDNENTLNGTIKSTGPIIDAIKLYSPSTITWAKAKISQMNSSSAS